MALTNLERELLSCVEELGKGVTDCMTRLAEQERMLAQLQKDLQESLSDLEGSLENASRPQLTSPQKPARGFRLRNR
ncbi:hypothetical protein [Palleronia sp.]|uniref:hypothetical protein n=1 Tax=Palleronia sp. TaxID=1940284 RepID=UPI0035C7B674